MKKFLILASLAAVPMLIAVGFVKADKTGNAGDAAWTADYKKAFEQAKAEHKFVMIDFSGESWCRPCQLLKKEVFSTKQFQDYTKDKFILVKVDFPTPVEPPKAGRELIEKYLPEIMLPTVVITAPDGKMLGQAGYYPGGPDVFVKAVQRIIKK